MKVQNTYHKKLIFVKFNPPFTIESGEIKTVSDRLGSKLKENSWIIEIKPKIIEVKPKLEKRKIKKTRKKRSRKKKFNK